MTLIAWTGKDWSLAAAAAAAVLALAACELEPERFEESQILLTTLSEPPKRSLERSWGFHCQWFTYSGGDYAGGFNAANAQLRKEGARLGANAFVNMTVTTVPPAGASGSLIMLCGDFVRVR